MYKTPASDFVVFPFENILRCFSIMRGCMYLAIHLLSIPAITSIATDLDQDSGPVSPIPYFDSIDPIDPVFDPNNVQSLSTISNSPTTASSDDDLQNEFLAQTEPEIGSSILISSQMDDGVQKMIEPEPVNGGVGGEAGGPALGAPARAPAFGRPFSGDVKNPRPPRRNNPTNDEVLCPRGKYPLRTPEEKFFYRVPMCDSGLEQDVISPQIDSQDWHLLNAQSAGKYSHVNGFLNPSFSVSTGFSVQASAGIHN